jgi:hypothetical protein
MCVKDQRSSFPSANKRNGHINQGKVTTHLLTQPNSISTPSDSELLGLFVNTIVCAWRDICEQYLDDKWTL